MIGVTKGFLKKFFYSKTESDASLALKVNTTTVNSALALKANLASPALTGTPTAPTAAVGTNTTQLATTAWVRAAMATIATAAGYSASFGTNGYIKFPSWFGGLVIQWGRVFITGGTTATVTLPLTFPNAFLSIALGDQSVSNANQMVDIISTSQFSAYSPASDATGNGTKWIAIGY